MTILCLSYDNTIRSKRRSISLPPTQPVPHEKRTALLGDVAFAALSLCERTSARLLGARATSMERGFGTYRLPVSIMHFVNGVSCFPGVPPSGSAWPPRVIHAPVIKLLLFLVCRRDGNASHRATCEATRPWRPDPDQIRPRCRLAVACEIRPASSSAAKTMPPRRTSRLPPALLRPAHC